MAFAIPLGAVVGLGVAAGLGGVATLTTSGVLLYIKFKNGRPCSPVHRGSYQWKREDTNGKWVSFTGDENKRIESLYCLPENDIVESGDYDFPLESSSFSRIDFEKMTITDANTGKELKLYRQHTPPVCEICNEHSAQNVWYWKSDDNRWIPYGEPADDTGYLCDVSSETIDKVYKYKPAGVLALKTEKPDGSFFNTVYRYQLSFSDLTQKNRKTGKLRPVKKRPIPAT